MVVNENTDCAKIVYMLSVRLTG